MKLLDKFLKVLKTNRNTFFTYLLTLVSIYIIVDRVFEFLLILLTGVASHYMGPIGYTISFLVLTFAYNFSYGSSYVKADDDKLGWLYAYLIGLYILVVTMITEWVNQLAWIGLLSLPNYYTIATEFSYLIKPALGSLALALPLATVSPLFNLIYIKINDSRLVRDSVFDYEGISLTKNTAGVGKYSDEIYVGGDKDHGYKVKLIEKSRLKHTLVCGISGSGKTSLIFEPWIAQDINKKFFYHESAKTLAFSALRAGICKLNAPYSNQYINDNFSLNMLTPSESKTKIFKSYFEKLIYCDTGNKLVYRDLGLTYMSPEIDSLSKMAGVVSNFGFNYSMIDPTKADSLGLNPFAFNDVIHTANCISTVLNRFFVDKSPENAEAYKQYLANEIIENLVILLKVSYPLLNDGQLPNLDDLLKLLHNFQLIEKLTTVLESHEELARQYENQINYFKKNFFHNSPNVEQMRQQVAIPAGQLDTLLRYPGVKAILCNRTNNLDYDKILENGGIVMMCTRRSDLGENAHKAFGLFFLLYMQYSVLRRPGSENSRIPHYLYIDEFPDFVCEATESIFTVYGKYKVATVISSQTIAQLKSYNERLGETVIANCANKLVFGNNTAEENEWWEKEIGGDKRWYAEVPAYNWDKEQFKQEQKIEYTTKPRYYAGKIQVLKFKRVIYKLVDGKGKIINGQANLDFLSAKYKEKQHPKTYNFSKFTGGIVDKDTHLKQPVGVTASSGEDDSEGPIIYNPKI